MRDKKLDKLVDRLFDVQDTLDELDSAKRYAIDLKDALYEGKITDEEYELHFDALVAKVNNTKFGEYDE